ncbi:AraC family transcriptional regulator [Brevibacillus reuszeri]|nr:AraC family transcriptional regulator [Brevibacillus reuszeri]KNB70160.1 transcriptional regulator [Brevibacillus reuszeri]MED1858278.1 AraC family transcriptional regulator [Brevibacillus reuszeri]
MNYLESMADALSFIENHLTEALTVERIATSVGYSKYHFQRLFHHVTGETVGQYITKRRLTEAAKYLSLQQKSVTEAAFTYGFESHEAFTRAFAKRFGIPPSALRKTGRMPRFAMKERLQVPYLRHIQTHLIEPVPATIHHAREIVGYACDTISQKDILSNWQRLSRTVSEAESAKMPRYGVLRYPDAFGLDLSFTYLAGVESSASFAISTEGSERWRLPAANYLVFPHKGPTKNLPLTYQYIYGSWFSQSAHLLFAPYDFEYYDDHFLGVDHPDSLLYIYVPVLSEA